MGYTRQDFSNFLIGQSVYYDTGSSLYRVLKGGNFSPEACSEIRNAKKVATTLHRGIYRDIGERYIRHLFNVVGGLILLGNVKDPDEISAGYLHDIREMTNESAEILNGFNTSTNNMVNVLTRKPGEERDHYRSRIINSSPRIYRIKSSDLRHNTADLWLALLTGHLSEEKIYNKLKDVEFYEPHFSREVPRTWEMVKRNMNLYEKVKREQSCFRELFETGRLNPESLLSHLRSEEVPLLVENVPVRQMT